MPYTLEDLQAQRDTVFDKLKEMDAVPNKAKATYSAGGESVDWNTYREVLQQEISWLNEQIAYIEGPAEEETEGLI